MKISITCFLTMFTFVLFSYAQNAEVMADDKMRIAIGVVENFGENIPDGSAELLRSRLESAATLNGLSAISETLYFNVYPSFAITHKELTGTLPPMVAVTGEVSVKIGDANDGTVFEQVDFEVRGVGKTEEQAITNAIKVITARHPKLKHLFREGKRKILEYYNGNCDVILAKADGMIAAQRYLQAYSLLMNMPPVARECHDKAMKKIESFGEKIPPEFILIFIDITDEENESPFGNESREVIELPNNINIEFERARDFGDQTTLTFKVKNLNKKTQKFILSIRDVKIINQAGEEYNPIELQLGLKKTTWARIEHDVIFDIPLTMTCVFSQVDYIRQFVFQLDNKVYRLDKLSKSKD